MLFHKPGHYHCSTPGILTLNDIAKLYGSDTGSKNGPVFRILDYKTGP